MVNDRPVFVHHRKEPIHQVRYVFEVRRNVVTNINRLFAVTSSELRNVSDRCVVESPEGIFIERFYALLYSYLDTVGKQIVLAEQILFLNPSV